MESRAEERFRSQIIFEHSDVCSGPSASDPDHDDDRASATQKGQNHWQRIFA